MYHHLDPGLSAVALFVKDDHTQRMQSILQSPCSPARQQAIVNRLMMRAAYRSPADGVGADAVLDHEMREVRDVGAAPDFDPALNLLSR